MKNLLRRAFGRPSETPAPVEVDLTPYVAPARAPRGNAALVLVQAQASELVLDRRLPGQPAYGPWSHAPGCACTWCR